MLIESLYYLLHNSLVDHHKYVSNKRSYHKICRISNRICQENGLATIITWNCYDKRFALIYLIANLCFCVWTRRYTPFSRSLYITSPSELVFPDIPLMLLSCTYFSSFLQLLPERKNHQNQI